MARAPETSIIVFQFYGFRWGSNAHSFFYSSSFSAILFLETVARSPQAPFFRIIPCQARSELGLLRLRGKDSAREQIFFGPKPEEPKNRSIITTLINQNFNIIYCIFKKLLPLVKKRVFPLSHISQPSSSQPHTNMTCTPQHFDYSIPPSPIIPPVPCVSRASSSSSLNSLYELDGEKVMQGSFRYSHYEYPNENPRTPPQTYLSMAKTSGQPLFTVDDIEKAFQDRHDMLPPSHSGNRLAHDVSDPQSPWKRSIRLRYSDVNMRDSSTVALQEASNLLSQDMSSYVCET